MQRLAYALTIALIFAIPWEAGLQLGPIGRASKLLGLAAALAWGFSVLLRGRVRKPDRFQQLYLLFAVWSGLTFYWSVDSDASVGGVFTYTQILVLVLLLWNMLDTRDRIDTAIQAYVLGAYVTAGSILVEQLTSPDPLYAAHTRINALGYQTDGIALIVAIAGPAAWYLAAGPARMRHSSLLRTINFAYLPIGAIALVLTGTRGATLASIPTFALILWSLSRMGTRSRLTGVTALIATAVLIVQFAPTGQLNRIATAASATELGAEGSALSGRWSIWGHSTRLFLEHPLTGIGIDAHRAAVSPAIGKNTIYHTSKKEAHNTYISVLTETGVIGFLLFAGLILSVVSRIRRLTGWHAAYWSAQVSVLAIGAMSLSLEDSKSVWIFLSLAVATACAPAVSQREREPRRARLGPRLAGPRVQPAGGN